MELKVGMPAPDFTLPLATFGTIALSNMRGKPVVLYFYPKDDTPGCTTEACDFRDNLPKFGDFDAAVIGISKDTVESHAGFAKKHLLNFHLASDAHSHTCEDYGVWVRKSMGGNNFMGVERSTFLIDRHGIIRHIWRRVSVPGHVEEVRQMVEDLHHGRSLPGDRAPEPPPPPPPQIKSATPVVATEPARAKPKLPVKPAAKAKPPAQKPAPVAKAKPVAKKKPAAKKPAAVKKPSAQKPAAKKAVAKKVVAKKPAAKKPSVKKPSVKKPAVKKPVAQKKKTVAQKTATKAPAKSATRKPVKSLVQKVLSLRDRLAKVGRKTTSSAAKGKRR